MFLRGLGLLAVCLWATLLSLSLTHTAAQGRPGGSGGSTNPDDGTGAVSTILGNRTCAFSEDGDSLASVNGLWTDSTGAIFFAETGARRVRVLHTDRVTVETIAGTGETASSPDGLHALNTSFRAPYALVGAPNGTLFVSDMDDHRVRIIDVNGTVRTLAGIAGAAGSLGDNGPATAALLNRPAGLFLNTAGELFVVEFGGNKVRKIDTHTGIITCVAGSGNRPRVQNGNYIGEGVDALTANLYNPRAVYQNTQGDLFIADFQNHRIRKVDKQTNIITTFAGGATNSVDDNPLIPATSARIYNPTSIATDNEGNLYIGTNVLYIHIIYTNGLTRRFVGTAARNAWSYTPDGEPGWNTTFAQTFGVTMDSDGQSLLYYDGLACIIRRVGYSYFQTTPPVPQPTSQPTASPSIPTSQPTSSPSSPTSQPTSRPTRQPIVRPTSSPTAQPSAQPSFEPSAQPTAMPSSPTGQPTGQPSTQPVAHPTGQPSVQPSAQPTSPTSQPSGQPSSSPTSCPTSQPSVPTSQPSSTPSGLPSSQPSGCPSSLPTSVPSASPTSVFVPKKGQIATVAGDWQCGVPEENVPATSTSISYIKDVYVDHSGNLFTTDSINGKILKVDTDGIISFYGNTSSLPTSANFDPYTNMTYTQREFSFFGITGDTLGNLYVSDAHRAVIYKVEPVNESFSVFAGRNKFSDDDAYDYLGEGDGFPANYASFDQPMGLFMSHDHQLYVADKNAQKVRAIDMSAGGGNFVRTVLGTGERGTKGDGWAATDAELTYPQGVWVNTLNELYVAEGGSCRVRKVDANGIVSTFAGTGVCDGYIRDVNGIDATSATIPGPTDVAVDSYGNVYISTDMSYTVRIVYPNGIIDNFAGTGFPFMKDKVNATEAQIGFVSAIFVDTTNDVYLADQMNCRVRRVEALYLAPTPLPSESPTIAPTEQPTKSPTDSPTVTPTLSPTERPTISPTQSPSHTPTVSPSVAPSLSPTIAPSRSPTVSPTISPTLSPTLSPSMSPTLSPSTSPSLTPTVAPSQSPSTSPTQSPTLSPTVSPTQSPSQSPTLSPTQSPTQSPTLSPTQSPTLSPSHSPTESPTVSPSVAPSNADSLSFSPSHPPTHTPTHTPTCAPTLAPTHSPTHSQAPTHAPMVTPSHTPTRSPTDSPTQTPTHTPTHAPTHAPTQTPTVAPSSAPTEATTEPPTLSPTHAPTESPVLSPTHAPSHAPTQSPAHTLTDSPSVAPSPSRDFSTESPSHSPTHFPTTLTRTELPTESPSIAPTPARDVPTETPTQTPTYTPTESPSGAPVVPRDLPTESPSHTPTQSPSLPPTHAPSHTPTYTPKAPSPTYIPKTQSPTESSSAAPSLSPTLTPSLTPTLSPSHTPTHTPTHSPSHTPTSSAVRSTSPSVVPTQPPSAAPTLPLLSLTQAQLSTDGTNCTVSLSAATQHSLLSQSFACHTVLNFVQANDSVCVWNDALTIAIYPLREEGFIDVNTPISLSHNAVLKTMGCATQTQTQCLSYSLSRVSVYVQAPLSPTQPQLSLVAAPLTLSRCVDLSLDLTASTGGGGRAWRNVSVKVYRKESASEREDTALSTAVLNSFSSSVPMTISRALFSHTNSTTNTVYTFVIRVCNAFSLCDEKNVSVRVSDAATDNTNTAIVSVAGPVRRSLARSATLSLSASVSSPSISASVDNCTIASPSLSLSYEWTWTVYRALSSQDTLSQSVRTNLSRLSLTRDPSKLSLPPLSLSVDTAYWVELSVRRTDIITQPSSTYAVSVYVQSTPIVARVSGASTRSFSLSESLLLDASASYDPDYASSLSTQTNVVFSWMCESLSQLTECPLTLSALNTSTVSLSVVKAYALTAVNTSSLVSVRVSQRGNPLRNATASVRVSVVADDAPIISVTSSAATLRNVNTINALTINALVRAPQNKSTNSVKRTYTAVWSAPSVASESLNLSRAALTSLSYTLSQTLPYTVTNLQLAERTLSPNTQYTFVLSAYTHASTASLSAQTAVQVTTNQAPYGGRFTTSPSVGEELLTLFTLSTSVWVDVDLPVLYEFGFFSPSVNGGSVLLTLRGKSESTYAYSTLPSVYKNSTNSSSNNRTLTTHLTVYDSMGASSSAAASVMVLPQSLSSVTEAVLREADTQIAANTSADTLKQWLSVSTQAVNSKTSCARAPNCATLNRESCSESTGDDVCGRCLSGYVGEAGHKNTLCLSQRDVLMYNGISCRTDTTQNDCGTLSGSGFVCDTLTLTCVAPQKTCASACAEHGVCRAYDVVSNTLFPLSQSCSVLSLTCETKCVCVSDAYRGSSCSLTRNTTSAVLQAKENLLSALVALHTRDDVSDASLSHIANNLRVLVRADTDLSSGASVSLTNSIAERILSTAIALNTANTANNVDNSNVISASALVSVLEPLDLLLSQDTLTNSSRAEELGGSLQREDALQEVYAAVENVLRFAEVVRSTQQIIGASSAITYLYNAFRLSAQSFDTLSAENTGNMAISPPITELERALGVEPSQISVPLNASLQRSVSLQAVEFSRSIWLSGSESGSVNASAHNESLVSNVFSVQTQNLNSVDLRIFRYSHTPTEMAKNFSTLCGVGDFSQYNHTCTDSGAVIQHVCNGTAGVLTSLCPTRETVCASVDLQSQRRETLSACVKLNETETFVWCRCNVTLAGTQRRLSHTLTHAHTHAHTRRLQQGEFEEIADESGALKMALMAVYVATQFGNTFKAAPAVTSAAALERVLTVIVMFSVLWAGGLLIIAALAVRKYYEENKDEEREDNKNKNNAVLAVIPNGENYSNAVDFTGENPALPQESVRGRERGRRAPVLLGTNGLPALTIDTSAQAETQAKAHIQALQRLTEYIRRVVPSVYSDAAAAVRVQRELLRHHSLLQLLFGEQAESERLPVLSVLHLLTVQTMLMFLLGVLYDLQGPSDDGSCVNYFTAETCLHKKSLMDDAQTYCSWITDADTQTEVCVYQDASFTFKEALYCAVVTSFFTAIMSRPIDYLFELLSSPTEEKIRASLAASHAVQKMGQRVTNAARRASTVARQFATSLVNGNNVSEGERDGHTEGEKKIAKTRFIPSSTEEAHKQARVSFQMIGAEQQVQRMLSHRVSKRMSASIAAVSNNVNNADKSSALVAIPSPTDTLTLGSPTPTPTPSLDALKADISLQREILVAQREHTLRLTPSIPRSAPDTTRDELTSFDTQWQWNPQIHSFNDVDPSLTHTTTHTATHTLLPCSLCDCVTTTSRVHNDPQQHTVSRIISHELSVVQEQSTQITERLTAATDTHAGIEILQLFIRDLLGRDSPAAKIFLSKTEEDYKELPVIKYRYKALLLLCVMAVNIFFVYFTILRSYQRGLHWQRSYLVACIAQFLVEILLFESLECLYIHYFVPSMVSKEVHRIRRVLDDAINRLYSSSSVPQNTGINADKADEDANVLNAPEYLFISTNVAKRMPHLMESLVVLSYRNHFPGEIMHKWMPKRANENNNHNEATFVTAVYSIATFISVLVVQLVAATPFELQRAILRFIEPFILGGLAYLWILIESRPEYIAIFAICVCALCVYVGYAYYTGVNEKEEVVHAVQPLPPSTPPSGSRALVAKRVTAAHNRTNNQYYNHFLIKNTDNTSDNNNNNNNYFDSSSNAHTLSLALGLGVSLSLPPLVQTHVQDRIVEEDEESARGSAASVRSSWSNNHTHSSDNNNRHSRSLSHVSLRSNNSSNNTRNRTSSNFTPSLSSQDRNNKKSKTYNEKKSQREAELIQRYSFDSSDCARNRSTSGTVIFESHAQGDLDIQSYTGTFSERPSRPQSQRSEVSHTQSQGSGGDMGTERDSSDLSRDILREMEEMHSLPGSGLSTEHALSPTHTAAEGTRGRTTSEMSGLTHQSNASFEFLV